MEHTKGGKCNKHGAYTDKYCPGCVRAAAPALLEACKMGLKLAQMLNHPDEYHIEAALAKAKEG